MLTDRPPEVRKTLLEAAIDASCIARACEGPVRLIDATPQEAAAFAEAGLLVDPSSTTLVASARSAPYALSVPDARRVFVPAAQQGWDAVAAEAATQGFSVVMAAPLDCLRAVARSSRRVPPEFWRRIFAWLERAPALRSAIAYAEGVASRMLPMGDGLRALLDCARDSAAAPSTLRPPQWTQNTDIDDLLRDCGLDLERIRADVSVLLERDPRSTVILWFVSATLESPRFDSVIRRLCPETVIADFDCWTRNDAMDRNVSEIAQTWYQRILPGDNMTYRGLEIGFALETESVRELLDILHFTPLRDGK